MNDSALTPLEAGVLGVFHDIYRDRNFPAPEAVRVRSRTNTGAGRYVELESAEVSNCVDGYLDMGGRFVEMEGVPFGIMAVVAIERGKLVQLELAVYGEHPWDGTERKWTVVEGRGPDRE